MATEGIIGLNASVQVSVHVMRALTDNVYNAVGVSASFVPHGCGRHGTLPHCQSGPAATRHF